jgi:hypothetical protein
MILNSSKSLCCAPFSSLPHETEGNILLYSARWGHNNYCSQDANHHCQPYPHCEPTFTFTPGAQGRLPGIGIETDSSVANAQLAMKYIASYTILGFHSFPGHVRDFVCTQSLDLFGGGVHEDTSQKPCPCTFSQWTVYSSPAGETTE